MFSNFRTATLVVALVVALPAVTAFQKPDPKGAKPEAAGPITPQMLQPLELIAHQLAKGGREREMKDLLFALEKLGYAKANHDKLTKACLDELGKAKDVADSLPQAAKQLRATAKQLAVVMATLTGEDQLALARRILMLDGENAEAHAVLQHVKVGKGWASPDEVEMRKRRGEIFDALQEAKKLAVEMDSGECEDEFIEKLCGTKATFARRGLYELHSNFNLEKTERIMRETCRAYALSWYLRSGKKRELKLPPHSQGIQRRVWVLLDSREKFLALGDEMRTAGRMEDDDAKLWGKPDANLGSFHVKQSETSPGCRIQLAQIEAQVQTTLLVQMSNMREGPPTPLTAGHLNWVSLACFGNALPNYVFKESARAGFGDTRVETEEQKREREEMLRLAKSGIAGSRTWMAYLAARGEDPAFAQSFVDALGAISGNDLHKCTSIVEYLQEADLFADAYSGVSKSSTGKLMERYATAMGMTIGDLESKWHEWILGGGDGIAERIDKKNENAFPADALKVLAYMNELREKAFKGKIEGTWKLRFDPDLSESCGAHAEYLNLHPEQKKWPDAHEEYADKEGYTPEGQWAGAHSVIVWGDLSDYIDAVDGWMGTFYHRLPLVDPGLLRIGWGWKGEFAVMDTGSLAAPYAKPFIVTWPHADQQGVPTAFYGNEYPDPVPDGEPGSVNESELFGYPITLQTQPLDDKGALNEIVMELFCGKDQVDCHFSSPQKPTNPELAPAGAWCLLPKGHLKPATEYRVVADWKVGRALDGRTNVGQRLEWRFRTK